MFLFSSYVPLINNISRKSQAQFKGLYSTDASDCIRVVHVARVHHHKLESDFG